MTLTVVRTNLRITKENTLVYDCEITNEEGKGTNSFVEIETSVYIPALSCLKITIPD